MPTIQIKRGNPSTKKLLYAELAFNTSTKQLMIGSSSSATSTPSTSIREVGRPVIALTQAEYNALSSKDSNTVYIIQTADSIITNSVLTARVAEVQAKIDTLTAAVGEVTSAISSLNSKQDKITGSASNVVSSNFKTSRALMTKSNQTLFSSDNITSTELGYLSGVTSNIQTQLNGKMAADITLPIANGGTGATTASAARTNLGLKYDQLWSGSITSGSMTVNADGYDFLIITGTASSPYYGTQSFSIPMAYLTSTDEKWQIANQSYYIAFYFKKNSSNVVTITWYSGSSNGRFFSIYGVKVGG